MRNQRRRKSSRYSVIESSAEEITINVIGEPGFFTGSSELEAAQKALYWIAQEENIEEKNVSLTKI